MKTILIRSLPLYSEALIAYSLVGIVWELLSGTPPLSLVVYLTSCTVIVAANVLFLKKPRPMWKLFLLNIFLAFCWIPALYATVSQSEPLLQAFPLSLFAIPLIRGYQHSIASLTPFKIQTYAELTQLYILLYLIVACYVPGIFHQVPPMLVVMILELWALVQFRTSAPNVIRAGGPQKHGTVLFLLLFAGGAACTAWLLFCFREELQPVLAALQLVAQSGLILLVKFMNLLVKSRSTQAEALLVSEGNNTGEPDMLVGGQMNQNTQLILIIFYILIAALLLITLCAILRWLCKYFRNIRQGEDLFQMSPDESSEISGLLRKIRLHMRIRHFSKQYRGSPRAALLQLEQWGKQYRCARKPEETPKEYLQRIQQTQLSSLPQNQKDVFSVLQEDIDRALYGETSPQLSPSSVCELLLCVKAALQKNWQESKKSS